MKYYVVYDSIFGNTEKVAAFIHDLIGRKHEGQLIKVADASEVHLHENDLLIVGSPTRAFRPTKAMITFLKSARLSNIKTAVFDTRMKVKPGKTGFLVFLVKLFGYANETMQRMVVRQGGELISEAQGFFVRESEGPLEDNELQRVEAWCKEIMTAW